jgi:predicted enzyme related to lactoylglutathione lyase
MRKICFSAALVLLVAGFTACMRHKDAGPQTPTGAFVTHVNTKDMKNLVTIIEIPTTDLSRAIGFYETTLGIKIEVVDMDGIKLGMFPNAGDGVFVQLIRGDGYKPCSNGTLIYLNAGDDLQATARRVEENGGKIIVPKTEISADMGYFAVFTDTEGNKVGLHAYK